MECNVACSENCVECCPQGCKKCQSGYSIAEDGTCTNNCGTGFTTDSVQCIPCQEGCDECDITGMCLSWSATLSSTCSSGCSSCIDGTQKCVACTSPLLLHDSSCVSDCPEGSFPDSLSQQCRSCPPTCKVCTSYEQCSMCIDGFFKYGSTCTKDCPVGTYGDVEFGSCEQCSSNCKSCFGGKEYQCLDCFYGYKLDHSECVTNCPVNRYEDDQGHCDWCHESCKSCYGPADFQCH